MTGHKMLRLMISIHVPAWGTTVELNERNSFQRFQSTFPRGERRFYSLDRIQRLEFQSTFPRGERLYLTPLRTIIPNFNPRSRVGNDGYLALAFQANYISIHVPAWGTTLVSQCNSRTLRFQSTFPRGERHYITMDLLQDWKFQSTFPRGERRQEEPFTGMCGIISIHVPAWGTTYRVTGYKFRKVFQSTFPRGERRQSATFTLLYNQISIHVPAWGTTGQQQGIPQQSRISIHVPAWGTTV